MKKEISKYQTQLESEKDKFSTQLEALAAKSTGSDEVPLLKEEIKKLNNGFEAEKAKTLSYNKLIEQLQNENTQLQSKLVQAKDKEKGKS